MQERTEYAILEYIVPIKMQFALIFILALPPMPMAIMEILLWRNSSKNVIGFSLSASYLAGLIAFTIFSFAYRNRRKIRVYQDRIEKKGFFKTSFIEIPEIIGYRAFPQNVFPSIRLETHEPEKIMDIHMIRNRYQGFQNPLFNWISDRFFDLDQKDKEDELEQIKNDPILGATEEERLRTVQHAKYWNHALIVLALTLSIGPLFLTSFTGYEVNYQRLVFPALVWPVFIFQYLKRYGRVLSIENEKTGIRPDFSIGVFLIPLMIFMDKASSGIHILNLRALVLPLAVISVIHAFLLIRLDDNMKRIVFKKGAVNIIFVPCFLLYNYSVVISMNSVLDNAVHSRFQSRIIDKGISKILFMDLKYVRIAPWTKMDGIDKILVTEDEYNTLNTGDLVDVSIRKGWMGIPWNRKEEKVFKRLKEQMK